MPVRLIVIGDRMFPEFQGVLEWMNASPQSVETVAHFADLRTTLQSAGSSLVRCDLILVLQRHSFQDAVHDVPDFIGRTLGVRVLCCYARACDSDARSRDLWPPALRVPASCAVSVLRSEVDRIRQQSSQLPVTASPEEVFVDRCASDVWPTVQSSTLGQPPSCGVASDDRVLRRTIAEGLRVSGWRAFDFPLQQSRIDEFQKCHRRGVLLIDLDAPPSVLVASLAGEEINHPGFSRIGFSAIIPPVSSADLSSYGLTSLVSTQDLLHGILRTPSLQPRTAATGI